MAVDNDNAQIPLTVRGSNPVGPGPSLVISGSDTLSLPAGNYYFASMEVSGTIELLGDVEIYLSGSATFDGGSDAKIGGSFHFIIVSSGTAPITLSGRAEKRLGIHAVRAPVSISGRAGMKGAVWAARVTMSAGGGVTYDPEIASALSTATSPEDLDCPPLEIPPEEEDPSIGTGLCQGCLAELLQAEIHVQPLDDDPEDPVWLPQGNIADEAEEGNTVRFDVWWTHPPDGSEPTPLRITVGLTPSLYRGIAANFGVNCDVDFRIRPEHNPDWTITVMGLVARTQPIAPDVHMTITLSAYDFGGNTNIEVGAGASMMLFRYPYGTRGCPCAR